MAILESVGLKGVTLLAGFAGAVISLKFIEGQSVPERVTTVIAGALIAAYCTPLTIELLSLSASPRMEGAIAFLGGLFGMSIAGAAIKAIPEWVAAAKAKWLG